jgi:hypothetical protein
MVRLVFATLLAFIAASSAKRRCANEPSRESVLHALADFERLLEAKQSANLGLELTASPVIPVCRAPFTFLSPTVGL